MRETAGTAAVPATRYRNFRRLPGRFILNPPLPPSFDHLVGALLKQRRHVEAKRFGLLASICERSHAPRTRPTTASGWVIIESCGAGRSTHFHPVHDRTSFRESSSTGCDGCVQCMYVRGTLLPTGALNVSTVV